MIFYDGIVFSLQKSGGISVYFLEVFKRLNLDFLVSLYPNDNIMLQTSILHNEIEEKHFLKKNCPLFLLKFLRYFDVSVPKGISVFHSTYYRLPFFWQRKNIRIVTTVHDFTYERYSSGLKRVLHSFQKKRAVVNSDVIICISESTKQDLFHYIPEARDKEVHVIHNGVSDGFYPFFNRNFGLSNSDKVLFVGARSGYKNFVELVKAIASKERFFLVIVGGGDLTDHENDLLETYIPGRFEFHKFLPNEQLNQIFNDVFAFVYPSLYEGFGIPVIESMKAGCPVIASATSSLPEISGNAAILISPVNADQICQSLDLIALSDFREDLIVKGLENSSRFSWQLTCLKLEKIYLEES